MAEKPELKPKHLMALLRPGVYPRVDYWTAIQMMGNRMSMSEPKYGPLEKNYPEPKSALATAMQRLGMYYESGNTEHLLDAANMLVIEHLFPSHDDAHFDPESSELSPGLREKAEESEWLSGTGTDHR